MTALLERLGEGLTRKVSRRSTLEKMAKATFAAAAGIAAGGLFGAKRAYAYTCSTWSSSCECFPPNNRYCNISQCNAENCTGGCQFEYAGYPGTACWCTATCCNFNCSEKGYYKCCDCNCSGTVCSCAHRVSTCGPCGPSCC